MDRQPLKIGDAVAVKDHFRNDSVSFIWAYVKIEEEDWIVVNLDLEIIKSLSLKRVDNKNDLFLFQNLEYALVKHYQLNGRSSSFLGNDEQYFSELITTRKELGRMAEFFYLMLMQMAKDKPILSQQILPESIERILTDKYSVFVENDFGNEYMIQLKEKMKVMTVASFTVLGGIVFLLKQVKHAIAIAETIKMEDGRSFLQTIKEDKELLEILVSLIRKKSDYVKGMFSPQDTSENKPLTYALNNSFFNFAEPEVRKYEQILSDNNVWQQETKQKFVFLEDIDLARAICALYDKDLREWQKALLRTLGDELPVKKIVRGVESKDYKLSFYIPLFKWFDPNLFPESIPHLTPPNVRKRHIRKIKELIEGKI